MFSPDSLRVLTASFDKTARLWTVDAGASRRGLVYVPGIDPDDHEVSYVWGKEGVGGLGGDLANWLSKAYPGIAGHDQILDP